MPTTKKESLAHIVRQYAAANTTITRKKVREDLGLSVSQVDNTFHDLVQQGWLSKIKTGVYAFEAVNRFSREAPIEDRIWQAMRINPFFSGGDIALQAGSTDNYVSKKLREYRDAGLVVHRRSKPNLAGTGRVKVWALTQAGKAMIKRPVLDVFKADPLIEKTVKLNKLICTGRVKFNVTDRENALKLIKEIEGHLKEDTNE